MNNKIKELDRRGYRFARYCDDFLLVVKSQRAGERVKGSVSRFLRQYLNIHELATKSVQRYIKDVKSKSFPSESEQY